MCEIPHNIILHVHAILYMCHFDSLLIHSGYCHLDVQDLSDCSDNLEEENIQEAIQRSIQDMEQMYGSQC